MCKKKDSQKPQSFDQDQCMQYLLFTQSSLLSRLIENIRYHYFLSFLRFFRPVKTAFPK